jgi:hypothetical protein
MAEVSDSGHLRTTNPEHAVALLKKAKLPGYVFPERNGWVTFVYPPGDENRFDLEQANERLLLLYEYAAELGCWVTLYQAKKPITRLKASFDRPNFAFDRKPFVELELLTPLSAATVESWVRRAHVAPERNRAPYLVAERLHLPRYQWLSFLAEQSKPAAADPQRIEVLANGTVKRPPKPTAPHVAVASAPKKGANKGSKRGSKTASKKASKPGSKKKSSTGSKKTSAKKPAKATKKPTKKSSSKK